MPTPRVGGLALILGLLASSIYNFSLENTGHIFIVKILGCSILIFLIGFIEDFRKNILPTIRFFLIALSCAFLIYTVNLKISFLDFYPLDFLLNFSFFAYFFTIFAITGITNSFNILDGLNGLSSMTAILQALAFAYISFQVGDQETLIISILLISAISGFLILNFPFGSIFLGDSGAYLIGFFIGVLCISGVLRNQEVSPWFAFLITLYPIFETVFSILRRKFYFSNRITDSDNLHLHSILFKQITAFLNAKNLYLKKEFANSLTSVLLWVFCLIFTIIPALLFWREPLFLKLFSLLFCLVYSVVYVVISNYKAPPPFG